MSTLSLQDDMAALLRKLDQAPRPLHSDVVDALEAYVAADKACERAREAFEKAGSAARERQADLVAAIDRATAAVTAGEDHANG